MKIKSLENKLKKGNIKYDVFDWNGYNKDIIFTINNKMFRAGFEVGKENITDFCMEIGFCQSSQETQRIFFENFNHVLRFANR